MIRRLMLDTPAPVQDPKRHIRAIQLWAKRFDGWFPPKPDWRPAEHWHPPIDQRLTHPMTTSPAVRRQVAAATVSAAANLLRARADGESAAVAALLDDADLFGSEVQVFFDAGYFERFTGDDIIRTWDPLPRNRSLARELGFEIPIGLVEMGFHSRVLVNEPGAPIPEYYEHDLWWYADRVPERWREPSSE
jgi:hypothetical protein